MTDIREQEMQGKIDELTAQKASLEAENKQLRKQVEWLRKAQFGRKSETKKVVYPEEQMSLFNEAETEAKPSAPEPEISVKPHKRKKKVGHREELLAKTASSENCRRTGNDGLPGMWQHTFAGRRRIHSFGSRLHRSPRGSEGFLS